MAGFFAGHAKTWFFDATKPDGDLKSETEPADGAVTTSMKYNPTRTVDLVEAGRAAVAAGLPAVAFLSADDATRTVGRHLWPSKSTPGRARVGGDQLREVRVLLTTPPALGQSKRVVAFEGDGLISDLLTFKAADYEDPASIGKLAIDRLQTGGFRPCVAVHNALEKPPLRLYTLGDIMLAVYELAPLWSLRKTSTIDVHRFLESVIPADKDPPDSSRSHSAIPAFRDAIWPRISDSPSSAR